MQGTTAYPPAHKTRHATGPRAAHQPVQEQNIQAKTRNKDGNDEVIYIGTRFLATTDEVKQQTQTTRHGHRTAFHSA